MRSAYIAQQLSTRDLEIILPLFYCYFSSIRLLWRLFVLKFQALEGLKFQNKQTQSRRIELKYENRVG